MSNSATRLPRNVATSKAKAAATPDVAMITPAKSGPTTATVWPLSQLTAIAAGSRSRGTSRGSADARAGMSTAPMPAAMNATTYRAQIGGFGWLASSARHRLEAARRTCVAMSSRRRSTASATAPPPSENTRIGTSWTMARSPIESELWVSCHSSNGSATTVT